MRILNTRVRRLAGERGSGNETQVAPASIGELGYLCNQTSGRGGGQESVELILSVETTGRNGKEWRGTDIGQEKRGRLHRAETCPCTGRS